MNKRKKKERKKERKVWFEIDKQKKERKKERKKGLIRNRLTKERKNESMKERTTTKERVDNSWAGTWTCTCKNKLSVLKIELW